MEVGFATGHCLVAFARAVGPRGAVYGIDLSDRMVQLAKGRLRKRGVLGRCHLDRGDALRLPYTSGKMDAAFMSFTLEIFDTPDIFKVLRECRRVLHTGGRLVVVSMSKEGKEGRVVRALEWVHRRFPEFLDCRPILVCRALERAGFQIHKASLEHQWVPVEIVLGMK